MCFFGKGCKEGCHLWSRHISKEDDCKSLFLSREKERERERKRETRARFSFSFFFFKYIHSRARARESDDTTWSGV